MNILVVEDEQTILEGICEFLEEHDYDCFAASDGQEAIETFENNDVHLVLLDIMLPKLNGIEVLHRIRKKSSIPVLMLTAFNDDDSKIKAFSELCDGYIEKPFSLSLLKTRVDTIIKRYYTSYSTFTYKDCQVNFSSYTATYQGKEVAVHAKELKILELLLQHENIVLTRNQIIDGVWKEDEPIPYDRVVDVYIKELRKKLGLDCIETVRNVGYKMTIR
ncbi:response regulator transcription factor [uncultured Streptococcus sp.]|uniref:response regulator transcription factor n=1 Tax=uncultured Streptococcus sp. TaxID=83427 RepID=UPI0027DC6D3B|nr:response regulator transcription factor [uncultured Streptococcus sp.]